VQGNGNGDVDLDATMTTLGPEDNTGQGLILPSKVMYRPQTGKSVLGMNLVFVQCVVCVYRMLMCNMTHFAWEFASP
jgi:hypothetical protein